MVEVANLTNSKINIKYFQKIGEVVLRKLKQPKDAEVSLVFVGDAQMKSLNKKYRGINKATDVLSFIYNENNFLGEIVISVPTAKKQAAKRSYPLKTEFNRLHTKKSGLKIRVIKLRDEVELYLKANHAYELAKDNKIGLVKAMNEVLALANKVAKEAPEDKEIYKYAKRQYDYCSRKFTR